MKPLTKFNEKYHRSLLGKICTKLLAIPSLIYDYIKDYQICGCSLVKYVPSIYRKSMGATGSHSTSYVFLKHMFSFVTLDESDSFIDVGCGKGRVLAYLANSGFKGSINGVELNKDVAAYAQKWVKRYPNIRVECGNALLLDYNKYTVMFLGRPFEPPFFQQFIDVFEKSVHHPVKVIYYVDQQSGSYLNNRHGWKLIKRQWIYNSGIIYHCTWPQRFSLWEYIPE